MVVLQCYWFFWISFALFQKQISNGGPITLTNQNIVRYFMTIPEAANLVLEASALARGNYFYWMRENQ